jgi:hypothetical protein
VPAQLKPGATQLELVDSTKEPAELQIVQLDGGHTLAEFYPAIGTEESVPIPTWLHAFGGVGETSPGQTRSVVVDLKAGTYAWFSGTAPEQEGAQPQYKRGAEGSLEVTGDASGAQLPAAPAQVTAKELGPTNYQFRQLRDHRRGRPRRQAGRDRRAQAGQLRPAVLPHRPGRRPAARDQGQDDPGGQGGLETATVGGDG